MLTPGWAAGELFLLAGSRMSLPHSFYRPVRVYRTLCNRCGMVSVGCRYSHFGDPMERLSPAPRRGFCLGPCRARCATDCGIMSVGLPPHRQARLCLPT